MRLDMFRPYAVLALWTLVLVSGCTELYLFFGPGSVFGPGQTAVGGATTQPTVIAAPVFVSDQLDPVLEATAGAKVVVAAQLNDDNLDGVIDDNDEIDLVSGSDESQPIQIHLNGGNGASFTTISIAGGGPIARMIGLQVADFDVDGRPDIAVLVNDTGFTPVAGASLRGAVMLLFNPADPSNALAWEEVDVRATLFLPCDDTGMTDFAIADIDLDVEADGVTPRGPDIVLGSNEVGELDKRIWLFLNPGRPVAGGTHQSRASMAWAGSEVTVDPNAFTSLDVADIDRDGDLDIVAAFPTAKTFNVRWLLNPRIPGGVPDVSDPWGRRMLGQQQDGGDFIAAADIDLDGDVDVAAVKVGEGLVQWFENPDDPLLGISIVLQQTFPWSVYNLGKLEEGFGISQLQLVDLNMDSIMDCFVSAGASMVGMQRGPDVHDMWQAYSIVQTDLEGTIGIVALDDINDDNSVDIVVPVDRTGVMQDQMLIFTRLTP